MSVHCPDPDVPPPGLVYLVGAGPGSADLITVRGLRILRQADVVLHDALIHPNLLAEARPNAEIVHVGKRGYCVGSCRQEDINGLLVEFARAGKTVCRLKGGDPFVFGRGGEEAEYLAEHGIPFEVVPGVTSALAACAAANIPLTHRTNGQAVALVTGHFDPDSPGCRLDWTALAKMSNVVFYMGLRYLEKIAARLIAAGLSPGTPAAVVAAATLPEERVIVAPLCDLSRLAREAEVEAPAVIVVGEPVLRRSSLTAVLETALSQGIVS